MVSDGKKKSECLFIISNAFDSALTPGLAR